MTRLSSFSLILASLVLLFSTGVIAQQKKEAETPFLGITMLVRPNVEGILISRVIPGSSAAKAKFEIGDLLLRFDGRAADSVDALITLIKSKPIGQSVVVILRRRGKMVVTQVTLLGRVPTPPNAPVVTFLDKITPKVIEQRFDIAVQLYVHKRGEQSLSALLDVTAHINLYLSTRDDPVPDEDPLLQHDLLARWYLDLARRKIFAPVNLKGAEALPRRIAELIEKLGQEEYRIREQAMKLLIKIGEPAREELEKAQQQNASLPDRDLEIEWRIHHVLQRIGIVVTVATGDKMPQRLYVPASVTIKKLSGREITFSSHLPDLKAIGGVIRVLILREEKVVGETWITNVTTEGATIHGEEPLLPHPEDRMIWVLKSLDEED